MTKELTIPQWINILFLLEHHTPKEIYSKTNITLWLVYNTTKILTEKGYIVKENYSNSDKRRKKYIITDKGKELLQACKIICNLEKPDIYLKPRDLIKHKY